MTDSPTLTPRIDGLNMDAASRLIAYIDLELTKDKGDLDYPLGFLYTHRAQMRFAMGFPAVDVLDDFWLGSRILVVNPATHLKRFPHEQLLTRRILPVEFGILGGHVGIIRRLANSFGFPLITAKAGLGGQDLATEARVISPGLLGEKNTHPQHLIGVAAGVYAAVIASAARGYDDEVKIALNLLANADFDDELEPGYKAVMLRYAGLCEAVLELVQPGHRDFGAIIADQLHRYHQQLSFKLGDQLQNPTSPQRFIDTSSVAVFGLAVLSGYDIGKITLSPETAFYYDLLHAMQQPREYEEMDPHEAMRAAYEAAGVDFNPSTAGEADGQDTDQGDSVNVQDGPASDA